MFKFENQKALVAIGIDGQGCILGYQGQGIYCALSSESCRPPGAEGTYPLSACPRDAGLYVWEGNVTIEVFGQDAHAGFGVGMEGAFHPAQLTEYQAMLEARWPLPAPAQPVHQDSL